MTHTSFDHHHECAKYRAGFCEVRLSRSLVFCVVFCIDVCSFSFGHCVVCPPILLRWYLQSVICSCSLLTNFPYVTVAVYNCCTG
jgi:hypothetical protein